MYIDGIHSAYIVVVVVGHNDITITIGSSARE